MNEFLKRGLFTALFILAAAHALYFGTVDDPGFRRHWLPYFTGSIVWGFWTIVMWTAILVCGALTLFKIYVFVEEQNRNRQKAKEDLERAAQMRERSLQDERSNQIR